MESPVQPRVLALDVGSRRIGIALSDPLGLTAQPLMTLRRTNLRADLKSIARLVRKYEVAEIVVGNPLYMSGDQSPQAARAQAFADDLATSVAPVPIYLWDERLTTTEAHRHLDAAGVRGGQAGRSERTQIIDQVAAVLILQAFLDARAAGTGSEPSIV